MLKRITKRVAMKRFADGLSVIICPCKLYPSYPWNVAYNCLEGKAYLERAEMYRDDPKMWKGTLLKTAWALMYNNWAYYNATYETGYYAHYYIEE